MPWAFLAFFKQLRKPFVRQIERLSLASVEDPKAAQQLRAKKSEKSKLKAGQKQFSRASDRLAAVPSPAQNNGGLSGQGCALAEVRETSAQLGEQVGVRFQLPGWPFQLSEKRWPGRGSSIPEQAEQVRSRTHDGVFVFPDIKVELREEVWGPNYVYFFLPYEVLDDYVSPNQYILPHSSVRIDLHPQYAINARAGEGSMIT